MVEWLPADLYIRQPRDVLAHHIRSAKGDLDEAAKQVCSGVLAAFHERFPTHDALSEVPLVEIGHISENQGRLVRLTAMVQHDSLGEQFYIPLGLDRNGEVQNLGLFGGCTGASAGEEIAELGKLMGRRMIVVTSPPKAGDGDDPASLLVCLYDADVATKVNELVSILGILEEKKKKEEEEEEEEATAADEYPQNLPTLHALKILPHAHSGVPSQLDPSSAISQFSGLFAQLGLDGAASKKVLLALLSRVSSRTPGLLTSLLIGHFPLNIRVPAEGEETSDSLLEALVALHPYSRVIRLSPSVLEEGEFASRMDYESGRLVQGLLQVPDGTLVVIDERHLQPGKLSEAAARNLQALIDLISHQSVSYDFGGQPVAIPTNVPIISISHGKTILPIDDFVVLAGPGGRLCADEIPRELVDYIQHCRAADVEIQADIADEIERHYVEERKSGQRLDANHLGRVLNVARLVAASDGGSRTLRLAHYLEALQLVPTS